MNKIFKIIFAFLAILVVYSCTDLEEDLIGDVTTEISIDGVDTGTDTGNSGPLSAAYGSLRGAGTANHGGYYSIQEITSDEMVICAKGGDWFDGGILIDLHRHTYGSTHDFLNNTWTATYDAINTVNEVLDGDIDDNQRAQGRALRAYLYWRLLDTYGNVKVITEAGGDAPQSDRQIVFDFIESELLDVLGISMATIGMDLSDSDLGTDINAYQVNQYVALGFLAKLYLNAEVYTGTARWGEAAAAAGYIIDSQAYTLCSDGCTVANLGKRNGVESDPDELEGFAAVFAANNENNPEHIFSVLYDEATAGGMNFSQMNLHYSSQFTWNFDSQPWNGYATLEEFYNTFEDGDARKAASFIVGEQLDFGGSAILDYASDDGNLVLNYTSSINELTPNSLREAGARPGKFSFKQFGRPDMDNDYPILRLGQVYLMKAEAMARMTGNWNDALPDVNVLRLRAKVAELTALTADDFLDERGREMFQEGVRRTDLIRFGKYNDAWWEHDADPSDHVNIFPIPFPQIQASMAGSNPLSQNPGY